MPSVSLSTQSYIFDPRPNFPLLLTAKRYWPSSFLHPDDSRSADGLTLICAHATGFHKEVYDPVIEDLYALIPPGSRGPIIREVWSIDCPNHGDAALLNEETLRWGYEPIFGWQEYARGLHAFLAGLGSGVDVDFSKRRLVLVGHSFSAVAQVLALTYQPMLKPEALILLEIMCLDPASVAKMKDFLAKGSENRRDMWPSRVEAHETFKKRMPWKGWDPRVLQAYVEHGLCPLPCLEYPDKEGVTLKCTRKQETAVYLDSLGSSLAYRMMQSITKRLPTHLIYGAVDDYIPRNVKDEFLNSPVGVGGEQNLASMTRIPGAGHLAAQTHPREFAQTIHEILTRHEAGKQRKQNRDVESKL